MIKQAKPWAVAVAAMLVHGAGWAQGHGANVKDMKFAAMPALPACATAAVPQGDPAKGPSFILGKLGTNCVVPWHWHTANENIILVSGEARLETKDGKPMTLTAGGFAMMPSKHIHRFTCLKSCSLYVYSDAIFDIHYVNADGQEIAADEALKKKP
jgi:mannose-6-phosphate isomerase-like protein (cupin superfamily)